MTSPRAAVVFSPTDIDTLKLMWSRSVRSNFEEEMKAQDINNGLASKPETLDSAEFRYERQQTKNLDLAASVFLHYNLEIISYDQIAGHSVPLGTQREWGVELEASYHTDKTRLTVSHAYTKLIDFDLAKGKDTYISAKPYGVGDDLANWSNHLSKLTLQQKLDDKWTLNSSLRVYWGFPGLKDINKYWAGNSDPTMPTPDFPSLKPGYNEPFEGSYFLDLGLQYKASKDLLIGVTGYNLLGLFDKNLNKRNFLGASDFRDEAVAIGVSVEYKF
jgi:iron complex outermembrane receptor protein